MLSRFILLLTLSLCTLSERQRNEIFDINPDEVIGSHIDDELYEARLKLNQLTFNLNDTSKQSRNTFNVNATTEKYPMASVPPEIVATQSKAIRRRMKIRMLKKQLEKVLTTDLPSISEYIDVDDPAVITEKFDKLLEKSRKSEPSLTRREVYFYDGHEEPPAYKAKTKRLIFRIAEHFVYLTRYKLVLSQVLKKKYSGNLRYRIGFLFALLRHLKNMQKWLQWTYKQYLVNTAFHEVKILQKVMRLDIDIRNVVDLIQKTEYQKNMLYDPNFYDISFEKK
ncbi:uncharacterized protein LOC111359078 [Spodoptera litura]|uniref:Uncharacterized protein LOC111359078 n=1 Tax=Spodoptera litura TaxID=69820 RepID=A0A9J7EKE3_SPOLT|nr:uncharacterized protein LOC111359078 [Spodoptera litura]